MNSRSLLDRMMLEERRVEGMRLKSYLCPAGHWTCGVGATGRDIGPDTIWTLEQAIERLERDCVRSVGNALRLCPILYNQPDDRIMAVADFVFNLGYPRLASSTMRRRINEGNWHEAAVEMNRWVWGGGKKLPGLIKRRAYFADKLLNPES